MLALLGGPLRLASREEGGDLQHAADCLAEAGPSHSLQARTAFMAVHHNA